jgi:hypothetical protein
MDFLPVKQITRSHCATEAYMQTHSRKLLYIKIYYLVISFRFLFCIELGISNLTALEEIS